LIKHTQSHGVDAPPVGLMVNEFGLFLAARADYAQAEPLYRRALAIDEASLGPDHPNVSSYLNNLARLLRATNRLQEAEPLMRRVLEPLLQFTAATDHKHPHLQAGILNYITLLQQMGHSPAQIHAQLQEVLRPFGMQLGSGDQSNG
jgi:tetratricopeptide (TPR) repeat protein